MQAYAHFKAGPQGPFQTVSVQIKDDGRGNARRTKYMVLVLGHWRRVLIGYGCFCRLDGEPNNRLSIQIVQG